MPSKCQHHLSLPKPFLDLTPTLNPTTFVQADTSTFKQVVQMLAGSSDSIKQASQDPPPSSRNFNIPHHELTKEAQGFKLYERRNKSLKNNLMLNTLMPNFSPQSQQQQLSKLLTKKHA
ncbi:VQ motif-containing protein 4 [Glycine soja]|uniref:VQ motif-containing protein 4 n=1 Tax=Glycine soja TaxID=3848 RepID=A0A445EXU9_GLYSO|nr:VQ motif-containing protein 4 [Glycine soja]